MFHRSITLAALLCTVLLSGAGAAPTPVPGGANALAALSAKTGVTVFNGVLRIQLVALRDATAADGINGSLAPTAGADQKILLMQTLLRNGTHEEFTDLLHYTVADKDAVAVEIPSYLIKHINPHILQGASLRQSALFVVDKDFVPSKLIIDCATCGTRQGFRPVRFTLVSP